MVDQPLRDYEFSKVINIIGQEGSLLLIRAELGFAVV
jgi:hypothetical protein